MFVMNGKTGICQSDQRAKQNLTNAKAKKQIFPRNSFDRRIHQKFISQTLNSYENLLIHEEIQINKITNKTKITERRKQKYTFSQKKEKRYLYKFNGSWLTLKRKRANVLSLERFKYDQIINFVFNKFFLSYFFFFCMSSYQLSAVQCALNMALLIQMEKCICVCSKREPSFSLSFFFNKNSYTYLCTYACHPYLLILQYLSLSFSTLFSLIRSHIVVMLWNKIMCCVYVYKTSSLFYIRIFIQ